MSGGTTQYVLPRPVQQTQARHLLQQPVGQPRREPAEEAGHRHAEQVDPDHREQHAEAGEVQADLLGQWPGVLLDQQGAPDDDHDGRRRQRAGQELVAQMVLEPRHAPPPCPPAGAGFRAVTWAG